MPVKHPPKGIPCSSHGEGAIFSEVIMFEQVDRKILVACNNTIQSTELKFFLVQLLGKKSIVESSITNKKILIKTYKNKDYFVKEL